MNLRRKYAQYNILEVNEFPVVSGCGTEVLQTNCHESVTTAASWQVTETDHCSCCETDEQQIPHFPCPSAFNRTKMNIPRNYAQYNIFEAQRVPCGKPIWYWSFFFLNFTAHWQLFRKSFLNRPTSPSSGEIGSQKLRDCQVMNSRDLEELELLGAEQLQTAEEGHPCTVESWSTRSIFFFRGKEKTKQLQASKRTELMAISCVSAEEQTSVSLS